MPQTIAEPTPTHQTMRALVFDGTLRLGTLPLPAPEAGEVVVDVLA